MTARTKETAGLAFACLAMLAISLISLPKQQLWTIAGPPHAPWCLPDQSPSFQFGFADLAQATNGAMGSPTECEHGLSMSSSDTVQKTTTGVASYAWCTNTPSFSSGDEHWMLTPDGLEHWTGAADPPRPLPVVRGPDLRHLCLV